MSNKLYEENSVQAIAEAIRFKLGGEGRYKISEMAPAIYGITGGEEEWLYIGTQPTNVEVGSLWIDSQNQLRKYIGGEWIVISSSFPVKVGKVPSFTGAEATPTEQNQHIVPPADYDGFSYVDVNAIPKNYVGSEVPRKGANDLTVNGGTVTTPAGYYPSQVSKTVQNGSAGTPTAQKGTVSNHEIAITPEVTNTTGYITGGTKTGTSVKVSASELVSGSETKTQNGSYDVTNLQQLIVNVPTSEPIGEWDAGDSAVEEIGTQTDLISQMLVAIAGKGAGGGVDVEQGEFTVDVDTRTTALLNIPFTNQHDEPPLVFCCFDDTGSVIPPSSFGITTFLHFSQIGQTGITRDDGTVLYTLGVNSNTIVSGAMSSGPINLLQEYDENSNKSQSYGYYVTKEHIKRLYASDSVYTRAGRTYKWIAIWI